MDRELNDHGVSILTDKKLRPSYDREKDDEFQTENADEVSGLIKRRIWTTVMEADVSKDEKVLGGSFNLTLNNFGTPDEKAKVWYVEQGYNENENSYLVHDTRTLRVSSIKVVM